MSKKLSAEEFKKLLDEAPDFCLITGLQKCDSYGFDNQVVYLTKPAYDAYTLPTYNKEEESFYRIRIDMDDDFRREEEYLCDLDDLKNHPNLEKIKTFYEIK